MSERDKEKKERERERERKREGVFVYAGVQMTLLGMFAAGFSPLLSLIAFAKVLNKRENRS